MKQHTPEAACGPLVERMYEVRDALVSNPSDAQLREQWIWIRRMLARSQCPIPAERPARSHARKRRAQKGDLR